MESEVTFERETPLSNIEISDVELREGNSYFTHEEFVAAVNNYAKCLGFQTRLGKVKRNSAGKMYKRTIFCSREGAPGKASNIRNRPSQRCNCQFFVRASLNSDNGVWYIIALHLEHNHSMVSPNLQRFMANERTIPPEIQERIMLLRRAGCDIPTIRSILKEEFSSIVTWIYSDLYNFVYQREGTIEQRKLDANNFVKELENIKSEDSEFWYEVKINPETNELQQAIWMFAEQRINYCRFYDVVVFDNTYKTNRFNMPFGIFTGVNNYGQSVCFAGAIMCNESTDSFIWTFDTFLKMVNNRAPKVLLTDEDHAIIKATSQIFEPFGTKHTLCLWHLLKNVTKNLNGTLGIAWSEFIKSFYKCLNEYDEEGFLNKWEQLKSDYPAAVKYLSKMDKNIKRWAPCYNRQIFMADMTTTQRGESMNNLMKGYLDATTSLTAFLKAFESALDQRKEDAEFVKFREDYTNIKLTTKSPFEKQAMDLLTKYAFDKTQKELLECMMYKCEEIEIDKVQEKEVIFNVERFQCQAKGRIVKYNLESQQFSCSCNYMIFSGIICRHIFRVASQLSLEKLHHNTFLTRWCKDPSDQTIIKTYYQAFYNSVESNIIQETPVEIHDDDYEYLLNRTWQKVRQVIKVKPETAKTFYILLNESVQKEITAHVSSTVQNKNQIRNPVILKQKGRTSNKRIQSGLENKKPSKKRALNSNTNKINEELDHEKENNLPQFLFTNSKDNRKCPFCAKLLPNPLPENIRLLLRKIGKQNGEPTQEDRHNFCEIHNTETTCTGLEV